MVGCCCLQIYQDHLDDIGANRPDQTKQLEHYAGHVIPLLVTFEVLPLPSCPAYRMFSLHHPPSKAKRGSGWDLLQLRNPTSQLWSSSRQYSFATSPQYFQRPTRPDTRSATQSKAVPVVRVASNSPSACTTTNFSLIIEQARIVAIYILCRNGRQGSRERRGHRASCWC